MYNNSHGRICIFLDNSCYIFIFNVYISFCGHTVKSPPPLNAPLGLNIDLLTLLVCAVERLLLYIFLPTACRLCAKFYRFY